MESHILNMYHQTYQSLGHKIVRSKSESLSSESSCNQNSPEYTQSQETTRFEDEGQYWHIKDRDGRVWSQNQNVNITQSNQDTSIDEDENVEIQEISIDDKNSECNDNVDLLEAENLEENSLVEGDDYDVIQVFAVDPDIDLEASSDEDQEDYCIEEDSNNSDDGEYLVAEDKTIHQFSGTIYGTNNRTHSICQDSLGVNFDTAVVSNVDEYFIKASDDKYILEAKDEPVVKDVDEYFIKENKEDPKVANVENDIFIKSTLPEDTVFRISKTLPDKIFADSDCNIYIKTETEEEVEEEDPPADVSINESDLEVLPNIEDLKRFLLEDMSYSKHRSAQKQCSVSLPHSPIHNICMDVDAKTCLSFEDLNLDLSDLTFENDKEKSGTSSKNDDIPRTLTEEDVNSFLITNNILEPKTIVKDDDDLSQQDMDIDRPVDSIISNVDETPIITVPLDRKHTSTPLPEPNVLEFCIEKITVKKEPDIKGEPDDFVDVESCNDTVIPVLEANNLNSLLEQFEATEKLNNKNKKSIVHVREPKMKSLTSGMRLQDAGVQLNKTKMRQILMPSTVNSVIRRSPSPVHSDHDYCSSKKRLSVPNLKGGQSLLKPEVLSSNNRILNSRHRSCKNKKVVYHLSSDEESEVNNVKKNKLLIDRSNDDSDIKPIKKSSVKVKQTVNSNHRKKLSPTHSVSNDSGTDKNNGSVIAKTAFKASDTPCSQSSNGSIKLTIKNKSEVIIKNCDVKDNRKDMVFEKHKSSSKCNSTNKLSNNINNSVKYIEPVDRNKNKDVNSLGIHSDEYKKQEVNSNSEHFYTALFSNKQDVQIPHSIPLKIENTGNEEEIKVFAEAQPPHDNEQPQKKKKLNLQEYKLRRGGNSNSSSAQVSPEAIFPDMPCNLNLDKNIKSPISISPNNLLVPKEEVSAVTENNVFDPIREASRKILMNSRKQKAEAMRKRDEDIVMSKIPKVENLELQPLISDAEMMKIVAMTSEVLPVPVPTPPVVEEEKVKLATKHPPTDYDEMVVVSVGTNTDENVFKQIEQQKAIESKKRKSESPQTENKTPINFKIKKSDHVSKHNVFDPVKSNRHSTNDKNHSDIKFNKERLKDITATLKSVEKSVETKISSNSLFASIQDVVMKKTPITNGEQKSSKPNSPVEKREFKYTKTTIIREYDTKNEHGEDKIILHLDKNRKKPDVATIDVQTETPSVCVTKPIEKVTPKAVSASPRKRNDSDMSMSSEDSPVRVKKVQTPPKIEEKAPVKIRTEATRREIKRSESKEKRSRSRDRYDVKYRRSRSHSRGHRRKRSHSRKRSRSRGRYRRYRRSDSPYRRKRRTRTRSPYRSRRSPSSRRDYRPNRSRSRSKHADIETKSPVKKRPSPHYNGNNEKKPVKSFTPPLRKPTVSESSESSTSSSSSSSSSSTTSTESRESTSPVKKDEIYGIKGYRSSYSSEDRESNTPVEERRIVFVGRLDKDVTKGTLRSQFTKFGPVTEVRLHSKEDGSRYGFVTFQRPKDAWSAVEAANSLPQYDVGFGGRRAFCRQSYADLDGLEATYSESAFQGQPALPARRNDDMSFEQMLLDIKNKLNKRKGDKIRTDDSTA
ncbi:uncharacterized protein LOC112043985 [Bicyclus anynana]|uniref:Uncharacterized protein LOC112043985 n=1 Tax=Bicyclus anynana TaxID=110368 RepID=A0A6J1MY26_BICAN|nr:uncharacterized protein LOC112043985 [Bicyclus anynana]XP_023935455.2 uncharacterized protein LOC112043985 [Bicyclus anynana]XP_023935456.2 uncharacterized protein LOC112043985 [Bicyclus anynana]